MCIRDLIGTNLPLTFAPENGHMLGGALVNLTGPCFEPGMRVTCRFNTRDIEGVVLNENRASCVQPWTEAEGWVDFSVSLNGGPFYWKGRFYVEPPSVSPELVWFTDDSYHGFEPQDMTLQWDPFNLTMNRDAGVSISVWGYREDSINVELTFLYEIRSGETNDGFFDFNPSQFDDLDLGPDLRDFQMGMIQINLTNPEQEVFMEFSP